MSEAKFNKAVEIVGALPKDGPVKPTQDQQLQASTHALRRFYSNFKQATIGDVNTARPGLMDFTGKAKWDAWKAREGTSKEDAQKKYVELLLEILKSSDDPDAKKWAAELENA